MKDLDISAFLQKAEELKALFVLGQRVIPFLEEIFIFVKDIKPLLDDINVSIQENLKKMPNASKQLSKVTEANELATTEIMDIVDGIVYKADLINNNLTQINKIHQDKQNSPVVILDLIQNAIKNDSEVQDMIPKLTESIESIKNKPATQYDDLNQKSNELLTSIQDDSNSIMMSLQVQDITSQQIAAVNHLLQTIQDKLGSIIKKFQHSGMQEMVFAKDEYDERTNVSKLHRNIAFDPDAVKAYEQENRQDEIDALMQSHANGETEDTSEQAAAPAEEASADDIDALFNNNDTDEASADDIDALFSNNDSDEASADDIDALFSNNDSDEASADDIDALFSNNDSDEASADDIDALFANNSSDEASAEPETTSETTDSEENAATEDEDPFAGPFSQDDIDAMFGN